MTADQVRTDEAAVAKTLCDGLSARQREVMVLTAKGFGAVEVGGLLGLHKKTVEAYKADAFGKLGVGKSILAAVILAKAGLV